MALTSPPAQKPFPAPVNTTHLTEGSSSAQASCSAKARFMGSLIALRASGRLRVSVSTPSSSVDKRSEVPGSGLVVMVLFRVLVLWLTIVSAPFGCQRAGLSATALRQRGGSSRVVTN